MSGVILKSEHPLNRSQQHFSQSLTPTKTSYVVTFWDYFLAVSTTAARLSLFLEASSLMNPVCATISLVPST